MVEFAFKVLEKYGLYTFILLTLATLLGWIGIASFRYFVAEIRRCHQMMRTSTESFVAATREFNATTMKASESIHASAIAQNNLTHAIDRLGEKFETLSEKASKEHEQILTHVDRRRHVRIT